MSAHAAPTRLSSPTPARGARLRLTIGPGGDRGRRAIIAGLALGLLLAGALLPLWSMTLHAPQYPRGLRLIIDGRGASGDVGELNGLNHYIGMSPLPEGRQELPEVALFFPGVAALGVAIALLALVPWRWFRVLVTLGAWLLPVAFLADLQWRLYVFGHSLSPEAAFRLPAFTPRVLGPTSVMNFNVTAAPGPGLMLFVASALVLTVAPRFRFGRWRGQTITAAVVSGLLLFLASAAAPVGAQDRLPATLPAQGGASFDLAAAIAEAPPGATIEVPPGRYPGPIVLARPITLRGVGYPVLDGGRRGDVVVVSGSDVRLEGFEIRGSALAYSSEAAGVAIRGDRAIIRNNRIDDVLFGVYLAGVYGAVVEDNVIATADLPLERRGHAVNLWKAQGVRIRGNRIVRGKDGFYVSFSDQNVIERNTVTDCRYGIHYMYSDGNVFEGNVFRGNAVGGAVMYSSDVTLTGNTFDGSRSVETGAGLIFKDTDRVLIRENRIVRNRVALEFDNAPATIGGWVRVERNFIAFNEVGFGLMSTAAITATENIIVENLRPVQSRGAVRVDANRWSVGARGNYWSDYAGFDLAGDGVGDVPYRRTDLVEDLAARNPALQAFLFTPAHYAVETATRLVPLLEARPVIDDRAPLMKPPTIGRESDTPPGRVGMVWIGTALLVSAALGLFSLRLASVRA